MLFFYSVIGIFVIMLVITMVYLMIAAFTHADDFKEALNDIMDDIFSELK